MSILPQDIDPREFYKSKYLFYHRFTFWVVVIAAIGIVSYFVSDCMIFGRFAWETLPGRFTPLILLIAFIILNKKTEDYRIMVPASYLTVLSTLWCTIWVVYFLPDKTHFSEGSVLTQFLFFAVGFAAPWYYVVGVSAIVLASILGTDSIVHYPNLDLLIALNLPCLVGTTAAHFFLQKLHVKHFKTQKKLEYISMFDQLTGANNRNITQSLIKPDSSEFIDELSQPLSVAMFDIDLFKAVNDNYGHKNGDLVLKEFAAIVRKNMRPTDKFIRWGGVEFVMLLPKTSLDQALDFVDYIRKQVDHSENSICHVTISAGVSLYDGKDYKMAIDHADQALYKAKANGRNRVEVYN